MQPGIGMDGGKGDAARWAWGAAALLALAAGWEAWGYRVAFVTDAAGPRALPLLAAGLVLAGAVALALRPRVGSAQDGDPGGRRGVGRRRGPGGRRGLGGAGILRPVLAGALFFTIPVLISWLGFMVTAGGAMAGLAVLLGAPLSRALAAGSAIAVALYLLFVYALGVPLPVGALFLAPTPGAG